MMSNLCVLATVLRPGLLNEHSWDGVVGVIGIRDNLDFGVNIWDGELAAWILNAALDVAALLGLPCACCDKAWLSLADLRAANHEAVVVCVFAAAERPLSDGPLVVGARFERCGER